MVAGTFLFQVNARRLRRPLDTVDLEETPDSCERTGALMLWLSCEGQPDVWELFSDTSYLSAILDRQELMVAAPVDLRTKRAEGLSPQALQGFWSRIKMKNPKIVVMSPTVTTKNSEQKEVIWQQYRLCLAVAEYQILDGKIFLLSGPESENIWWLKKMQYLLKKFHCRWTLLRGNHLKWILSQFWRSFTTTGVCTDLAWASGSNGMASSFCSWRLFFEGRHDYNSNATVLAMCADQSLPGSCQFEHTRGSSIGHELDQGPTWRVEASEPCIGHYDRPSCSQSTETYDFRCSVHHEQMRVIGRRETTDPSRESVGKCWSFSPHMSVLKRHFFCRICSLSAVRYYRALSEAIFTSLLPAVNPLLEYHAGKPVQNQLAWGFVLQTSLISSRPHLIRVSGHWLYSGRKVWDVSHSSLHLRTKEDIILIVHLSSMILKFPLVHKVHSIRHLLNLITLQDRQVCLVHRQDGLQLHHQQVVEKELKQEIHRVSDYTRIREHHRLSLNLFPYQWVMVKMKMISQHRERAKDNGLDGVSEYIITYRCRWNHKFNQWLLQNQMMRCQMRILRLLIPHHHQLNKGIAPEDRKDPDHVSEYIHVHPQEVVNSNSLLYLLLREYSRIRQLRVMIKIQEPCGSI